MLTLRPMTASVKKDDFCLAPLRGVTVRAFRNLHAKWFTPPDRAVAPFIPTYAGERVKPALLKDVDPDFGQSVPLMPQVLGKDPAQLRTLLRAFKAMGYRCADLNAGCPFPLVVKKGRGAGLLRDAEVLERMLEAGCDEMPGGFSLKVRLGVETPDLLAQRMELINAYPLREVTVHARTARQMYGGAVSLDAFAEALAACRHTLVYNGDIRTLQDWQRLKQRFPEVTRWMVGRGAVVNLWLLGELAGGRQAEPLPERLKGFLDDYLAACNSELYGPAAVLGRMKELWSYLHQSLRQGERIWQAVRVCRTPAEYNVVTTGFFEKFAGFISGDGVGDNKRA